MTQSPRATIARNTPNIAVVGVGGGGGNAINNMIAEGIGGVDFIAANTDAQALKAARPDATLVIWPGVNHVLKTAPADRQANMAVYVAPDLPLSPVAGQADWIEGTPPPLPVAWGGYAAPTGSAAGASGYASAVTNLSP